MKFLLIHSDSEFPELAEDVFKKALNIPYEERDGLNFGGDYFAHRSLFIWYILMRYDDKNNDYMIFIHKPGKDFLNDEMYINLILYIQEKLTAMGIPTSLQETGQPLALDLK